MKKLKKLSKRMKNLSKRITYETADCHSNIYSLSERLTLAILNLQKQIQEQDNCIKDLINGAFENSTPQIRAVYLDALNNRFSIQEAKRLQEELMKFVEIQKFIAESAYPKE